MTSFELAEPTSLAQALSLLDGEGARPISGGTALMLMMKAGVLRPRRLVSLRKLGLAGIETGPKGELRVGGMTTLADLERSAAVKLGWPVIARALRTLSNVRVRNVATVGGSLAHGDPHMDLPPLLSALGARVTLSGPRGERGLPVADINTGYLETSIGMDELITRLEIPALANRRAAYLKCTTRSADDWPALGIAAVLEFRESTLAEVRLVIGAATDRPTRLLAAESVLRGMILNDKLIKRAADAALAEAKIEGDLHGSAAYKQQLVRVYLARAINEARGAIH